MLFSVNQIIKHWPFKSKQICFYLSYYEALQVDSGATQQEIKNKYYELAKKMHPDSNKSSNGHQDFLKITEAYECLSNQHRRKQYDNSHWRHLHEQQSSYYKPNQGNYQDQSSRNNHDNPYSQGRRKDFYQETDSYSQRQSSDSNQVRFITTFIPISLSFLALYLACEMFGLFKVHTETQVSRQNIILAHQNIKNSPSTIERRKLMYAQEMKDKKIVGIVKDLKTRILQPESTKEKAKRKQGIESIKGIQKRQKKEVNLLEQDYI